MKWIEVKPGASITMAKAVEFINEIMYRFGIPNNIIIDNGTQFIVRELKTFVQTRALKLIMPQCHTCRVMIKWSAQII
jgi:hypothetical protein